MREAKLTKVAANLDYYGEEALNTICTNISFAGQDVRKIVFTSNSQSEGKSFLSMQVSKNLARRGHSVCLVDADIRRSFLIQRSGFVTDGDILGLAHYLAGQCELDNAIYHTDIQDICIIPAGSTVANPIPLLDSPYFAGLLNQLAQSFDYVIVDTAPIGMVIDAAEIAKACDGIILVAEYNKTTRKELASCKKQMEQTGKPIIGCIINEVSFEGISAKHYYNKGYYKYYKSGYYKK